jgi:putative hemolysin
MIRSAECACGNDVHAIAANSQSASELSGMNAYNPRGAPKSVKVRLASTIDDVAAVQRLRWQVFRSGEAATGRDAHEMNLDQDEYDAICDHLMAVAAIVSPSGDVTHEEVVGTYRLLRGSIAEKTLGYYTAHEFDLSRLLQHAKTRDGEPLEIGRSCVREDFRTGAVIQALWRGLGSYVGQHQIGMLFGCASFPGTDPEVFSPALSFLNHSYLAPEDRRPYSLSGTKPALLAEDSYDPRAAFSSLPPLIKGYLRAGARFGEGVYVDTAFNTVDVCALVETEYVSKRYFSRFGT